MFADNLKQARLSAQLTLEELSCRYNAKFNAKMTKSILSKYERGVHEPSVNVVSNLASVLGCSVDFLIGNNPNEDSTMFPVIGNISAGYNGIVLEDTEDVQSIPNAWIRGDSRDNFIVLRVKGDSCYPVLMDGDLILVHKETSVDSGTLACVIYDDEMATVKRVFYNKEDPTYMRLEPINNNYPPVTIRGEEELSRCIVIGKVITSIRKF